MKNTRTHTKEFLGKTYVAGAMLSLFVALSFYNTVLVADEVFVIFAFGPELVADPAKIWSWALSASAGGWASCEIGFLFMGDTNTACDIHGWPIT